MATWPAWQLLLHAEQMRGLKYDQLPTLSLSVAQLGGAKCTLTQEPYAELLQPVLFERDRGQYEVFEFTALQEYWARDPQAGLPQNPAYKLALELLYQPQSWQGPSGGTAPSGKS